MVVNKKGFTLMELLVVITIMGVMISASAISITNSRNQRKVQSAAEQVRDAIVEAHSYAIAPKNLDTITPFGSIIINITPKVGNDSQTLKVQEWGTTDGQILINKGFAKDIEIDCASSDCIEFDATDSNTIGQATTNNIITVKNLAGTLKYKLTTDSKTGSVKMEKL